jgi:hypothetical protein
MASEGENNWIGGVKTCAMTRRAAENRGSPPTRRRMRGAGNT